MNINLNLIAIGRSRFLYDGIKHLASKGYIFKAIITEEAYEEYDIKHKNFEELSASLGAQFFLTKDLNIDPLIAIIKENNIRASISANWKYTIQKSFLGLFECGILNLHLGNLPDYKGNATVNWTIINGEDHINLNVHKMDLVLDAGDIVSRESIPITKDTYIADILKQAELIAPILYEDAVKKVFKDPNTFIEKGSADGLRCYPRLSEDSQIHWNQNAENVSRLIRASSKPYTGAFSYLNGEKIIIWKARNLNTKDKFLAIPGHVVALKKESGSIIVACADDLLEIESIEHNGKVILPATFIKSIRLRFRFMEDAKVLKK